VWSMLDANIAVYYNVYGTLSQAEFGIDEKPGHASGKGEATWSWYSTDPILQRNRSAILRK
jgi:hypothetical protein